MSFVPTKYLMYRQILKEIIAVENVKMPTKKIEARSLAYTDIYSMLVCVGILSFIAPYYK